MHLFYLVMLPFLDRVRDKSGLLMGIRGMVMHFLENLEGFVDGFSLGGRVGMWHGNNLSGLQCEKPLITKGLSLWTANQRQPIYRLAAKT